MKLLLPVLLLVVAVIIAGALLASKPQLPAHEVEERVWPVSTVPVQKRDQRPVIRVFGTIVAAREADIRPWVAGKVSSVSEAFVSGGVIRKGAELFRIDDFDYQLTLALLVEERAESVAREQEISSELQGEKDLLTEAETQLEIDLRDLARREDLHERGHTSERALDETRTNVVRAQENLIQRKQAISRLEARLAQQETSTERLKLRQEQARRDLKDTVFYAPFDGIILQPNITVGKRVATNDLLGRLIDSAALEARFQLLDSDYARLIADNDAGIDQPVKVIWRLGDTALAFQAHLTRQEPEIDAATGGVGLYARIVSDAVDTVSVLRPGAFVEVELEDQLYAQAIALPLRAVGLDGMVYAVNAESRLDRYQTRILRRSGTEVLIASDDLPEGTPIVTSRFPEISAGLKVEIRNPETGG